MHTYPTLLHIGKKQRSYCHVGDLLKIICRCPGFSLLGRWETVPLTSRKLAHSPHLEKFLFSWFTPPKFPSPMVKITPPQVVATQWKCYCVEMTWYTATSISRWLPLYLLHQVILPPLTLSLLENKKLKNSIFEMPIIQQTLNINNSWSTRAKSEFKCKK